MVSNGKPYIIGQDFHLGEKYTSEDMYRDYPDLRPGDRVAYERDGVVYTDTVQNITHTSGEPAIYPELGWWKSLWRRLTPVRYRKPVQPIRAAKPSQVTITTGEVDADALKRHQRNIEQAGTFIDGIIRSKPNLSP